MAEDVFRTMSPGAVRPVHPGGGHPRGDGSAGEAAGRAGAEGGGAGEEAEGQPQR